MKIHQKRQQGSGALQGSEHYVDAGGQWFTIKTPSCVSQLMLAYLPHLASLPELCVHRCPNILISHLATKICLDNCWVILDKFIGNVRGLERLWFHRWT